MQTPSSASSVRRSGCPETVPDVDLSYDRHPAGSRVKIFWPGDKEWYIAAVTDTRIKLHKVKTAQTECREIFCVYELDGHEQWHSLHNNEVLSAGTTPGMRPPPFGTKSLLLSASVVENGEKWVKTTPGLRPEFRTDTKLPCALPMWTVNNRVSYRYETSLRCRMSPPPGLRPDFRMRLC